MFEGEASTVVERVDLYFQMIPILGRGRRVVIPELLVGAFGLPLHFSFTDKGNANGSLDAIFEFFNPFNVSFHEKLQFQRLEKRVLFPRRWKRGLFWMEPSAGGSGN